MKVLNGHTSPETAFVVNDYPYGFRLRCKIRYWIEYAPKRGYRFVSQTTNPKKAFEFWNKPKASTYVKLGAVMVLNEENGHVSWTGLSEYADASEMMKWVLQYGEGLALGQRQALQRFIAGKVAYEEARKAKGETGEKTLPLSVGIAEARTAFLNFKPEEEPAQ